MTWQSIETAPKDGTRVLIYVPWASADPNRDKYFYEQEGRTYPEYTKGVHAARFDVEGQRWVVGEEYWSDDAMSFTYDHEQPTHWMPLPAPPQS